MSEKSVVSRQEWLNERRALLQKEKAFSRQRDELSAAQRRLPWVRVEKNYRFDSSDGPQTLAELFFGKSQLVVYHFMFGPGWDEGCKSCSFITDHYQGALVHLAARDVSLVAVSRAPVAELLAFKDRMGWKHPWVSSFGSDFNTDYAVTITAEALQAGTAIYNYDTPRHGGSEYPGLSVFVRNDDGIFHTYSTYGRGLDPFIGAYHFLDLVPKGRDESQEPYPMNWVRHHDRYPTEPKPSETV